MSSKGKDAGVLKGRIPEYSCGMSAGSESAVDGLHCRREVVVARCLRILSFQHTQPEGKVLQ
jgi:hypothetical protein